MLGTGATAAAALALVAEGADLFFFDCEPVLVTLTALAERRARHSATAAAAPTATMPVANMAVESKSNPAGCAIVFNRRTNQKWPWICLRRGGLGAKSKNPNIKRIKRMPAPL